MPKDKFGRQIDYLRVSVTDRCNLRCLYCSQKDSFAWIPHQEILSYEELFEVLEQAVALGFRRLRLTGGEPLVRRDMVSFIARLAKLPGLEDLSLTTNGTLLAEVAKELKDAGLRRVNISLDTLRPERFEEITGYPLWEKAWAGILAALEVGLQPVKINVVIMREINEDEILDLALLAKDYPLEVRFIEFMPVGEGASWAQERFISAEEVRARLEALGPLEPIASYGGGPASTYRLPGAQGKIGFITAMSNHFCARCNRLRLTPDGRLRPCLFSDEEIDLKAILRRPHRPEEIRATLRYAIEKKPQDRLQSMPKRLMRSIGG